MTDDPTPTSESTEPPTTRARSEDTFAFKFKTARTAARLSQTKAGALAKVSMTTIWKWENAKSEPTPQKQGAVLRKLREAANPVPELTDEEWQAGKPFPGLPHPAAPSAEELAHDPYEPVELPIVPATGHPIPPQGNDGYDAPASLPDTPVGNVHTSQDGVVRRRLADDDDREGAETIDGHKWFTVGFAPPHPRAKAAVKPISVAPSPVADAATLARSEPRTHTEVTPQAPKPAESPPVAPVASSGKRDWSWWSA